MQRPPEECIIAARRSFEWTDAEKRVLNPEQMRIVDAKRQEDSVGYRDLQQLFNLTGQNQVRIILERTFRGFRYEKGCNWKMGALSDVDASELLVTLYERAQEFNCCKIHEVIVEVQRLQSERQVRGQWLAWICNCDTIAESIGKPQPLPDHRWLIDFCASRGLVIRCAQSIDRIRIQCCTSTIVSDFFTRNRQFLSRDPHLLFNLDETSACFTRSMKVVLPNENVPFTHAAEIAGHMTCVACFNAVGWSAKLFFILSKCLTMPEELKHLMD